MLKSKKTLKNQTFYEISPYYQNWEMKLDSNESAFEPSQKVLDAIKNVDAKKIKYYPAYKDLQDLIAMTYNLEEENILCTNGADEAINLAISTFIDKNDEILTAIPTFSMPKIYASLQQGKYKEIEYNDNFEYPYEKIEKAISKKTKMIIFTTPNNPTGDIINKDFIEKIAQKQPNTAILIDATYSSFNDNSYFDLVKKYQNVIVIKSFSKDFALAGLRLGFLASQKNNILEIKKVQSPYSVNSIAIIAGIASLLDKNYIENVKNEIKESKKYLEKELNDLGLKTYTSYANFLLINDEEKAEFLFHKLKKNSIITKIFRNDKKLKNHLRITIPKLEDAKKLIQILKTNPTLVFDMDGVLIDVRKSFRKAIKETYKFFTQKEVQEEEIKELKNIGGYNNDWDLTEFLILKSGKKIKKEKIIQKFEEFYWNNSNGFINNELPIFDKQQLEELSKKYNLVIFTGRPQKEALYTLELFKIKDLFSTIITMDDVGLDHQKPDTKGFELIKQRIFYDDIKYFGDTVDDMICGTNAQIPVIGVLPPQDKTEILKKSLKNNGAMLVLDNITEIEKCLENNYASNCGE
ncbi:aminotransferase class I/II-fold pyridoxal phosphate-dependent enzyme [bacterium]|nr:aminotransferase class I/II-fold pyridoxal phosphate-dependent enzyme [bacterium]